MDINNTKTMVDKWVKDPSYPPLVLVGAAGVGKTQTIMDVCKANNTHLEIIRVGSLDSPGDLLGLPEIVDEGEGNKVTKFTTVEMFERLKNGGVLFLDELNRCKPVLMDSIMQILDQKRLANYDLSQCTIIGAMNPDTDDYSVTEMDKAVVDRCLFVKVQNSVDDVATYFQNAGFDARIPELTLLAEADLKCNGNYDLPSKELTPRGLRQLASVLPVIDSMPEEAGLALVQACIGPKGVATWKNKAILSQIPTASAFLSEPTAHDIEKYEPLKKRILLRRLDAYLGENKTKVGKSFTEQVVRFGKPQLAYIMRHLPNVNNKINRSDDQYAEMVKDIIDVLQN